MYVEIVFQRSENDYLDIKKSQQTGQLSCKGEKNKWSVIATKIVNSWKTLVDDYFLFVNGPKIDHLFAKSFMFARSMTHI